MLMKPTPEEIKINKYIRVLTYLGKILRENKKISSLFNLVKKKKKKRQASFMKKIKIF